MDPQKFIFNKREYGNMKKWKAEDLVNVLRYDKDITVTKISKKLGVHRDTVVRWGFNKRPLRKKSYQNLLKLVRENKLDVKKSKKILSLLKKLKKDDWNFIVLGIMMKLDLSEKELDRTYNISSETNISNWINGHILPSILKQYQIMKFILENGLNVKELIKIGNSIKINGKFVSINKAITRKRTKKDIILKSGSEYILNSPQLFPLKRNGKNVYIFKNKKHVTISYRERKGGSVLIPLTLNEHIKMDEVFLTGLGIYSAEGAKNRHPKITNSEPLVIEQAIKFFNKLGVPNDRLAAWLQLHERSEKSLNQAKKFWIKNTNLKSHNIKKLRMKKSLGNAKVKQYGTLHLEVNSILLQILIKNLLDQIPNIIKSLPPEKTIFYLMGEFAGEGSVGLTKKNTVQMVRYTSKDKLSRKIIGSILSNLDIKFKEDPKRFEIRICGFENFKKLHKLDIFKYHPMRRNRLKKGLQKMIYLNSIRRYSRKIR